MPEPRASPFGARFNESFEQPYLKDFVLKRRANVQREMKTKARKKEFYLPQAKHLQTIIDAKRQQQELTSTFEIDRGSYGLAYIGATPLKQPVQPLRLFSGISRRRANLNASQKLSTTEALSVNSDGKEWLSSTKGG